MNSKLETIISLLVDQVNVNLPGVTSNGADTRHGFGQQPLLLSAWRRTEWIGLLAVTLPVAAGILLAYSAKQRESPDAGLTDVRSLNRPELARPAVTSLVCSEGASYRREKQEDESAGVNAG